MNKFLILSFLVTVNAYGADNKQYLPDTINDLKSGSSKWAEENKEQRDNKLEGKHWADDVSGKDDWAVEGSELSSEIFDGPDENKERSNAIPGQVDNTGFERKSTAEVLKNNYKRGKYDVGFYLLWDQYNYKNDTNNFNQIFRDTSKSYPEIQSLLSFSTFFSRNYIDLKGGLLTGVGYNSGPGFFKNNNVRSETRFNFWTIPVEIYVGAEIPLNKIFKVAGTIGPSAIMLWQGRDDLEDGDKRKDLRQFGFGAAGSAELKISLTEMWGNQSIRQFDADKITRLYLSLYYRFQYYSQFKEESLSIEGNSVGLGISYEYL